MKSREITVIVLFILFHSLITTSTVSNVTQQYSQKINNHKVNNNNIELSQTDVAIDFTLPTLVSVLTSNTGDIYTAGSFSTSPFSDLEHGFVSKVSESGIVEDTHYFGNKSGIFGSGSVALDSNDNFIVGSLTNEFGLPVSGTSSQSGFKGVFDGYISYNHQNGSRLWSTYIGGFGWEGFIRVIVDSQDYIYLSIATGSFNFPIVNSLNNQIYMGEADMAFVKFSPSGELMWSTLIGGSGNDIVFSLSMSDDDELWFAADTTSDNLATVDGYQTSRAGDYDTFIGKLNTTNGELEWGSYFGGSSGEGVNQIEVGASGDIYFMGFTDSSDFELLNPVDDTFVGGSEFYVTKFSSSGSLLWSTYWGGDGFGGGLSMTLDNNDNPIFTGFTNDPNFPTTDSSQPLGNLDYTLTKIRSDGSEVMYSTVFGTEGVDIFSKVEMSVDNQLLIYANIGNQLHFRDLNLSSVYQFQFSESATSFILNVDADTLDLNWYSETIAIPDNDIDNDGLSNEFEYNLCMQSPNPLCLDPLDTDMDNDGMADGFEVEHSLNPLNRDSSEDPDDDELSNLEEFQAGTDPFSNDTDGDLMLDGWEVSMGLDPTLDDSDGDLDGDGMTNIFEYNQRFNATNANDGRLDSDADGLTNLEEFEAGTDPWDSDTDNDGMPDGWEVSHGLDPLDPRDASSDADGDRLPNRLEYNLKFNPNSPIELYVGIFLIILVVSSIFGYRRYRIKRNIQAKNEGWENYKEKKEAMRSGFVSFEEYKDAEMNGFRHTASRGLFEKYGYESVSNFNNQFDNYISEVTLFINNDRNEDLINQLKSTESPNDLVEVQEEINLYLEDLAEYEISLDNFDQLLTETLEIIQNENRELFVTSETEMLEQKKEHIDSIKEKISNVKGNLNNKLDERRNWFRPWKSLLSLIQITEDSMPIPLERISEVTQTEMEQAETLVISLLREYPDIGVYDEEKQIYKKGVDVSQYLKKALEFSEKL